MRCCLKSELLIIVPPTVASISDAVNTVSVAKTTAAVGETVTDIVTFGDSYTPTFALSGNNGTLSAPRKTAIRGRTPTPSPAEIPAFRLLPPLPTPPQATLPHPINGRSTATTALTLWILQAQRALPTPPVSQSCKTTTINIGASQPIVQGYPPPATWQRCGQSRSLCRPKQAITLHWGYGSR